MTDEMKSFLTELDQLLKKYDVEIEGVEEIYNYNSYCDGIEFYMNGHWDEKSHECTQPFSSVKLGRHIYPDTIKDMLDKSN